MVNRQCFIRLETQNDDDEIRFDAILLYGAFGDRSKNGDFLIIYRPYITFKHTLPNMFLRAKINKPSLLSQII